MKLAKLHFVFILVALFVLTAQAALGQVAQPAQFELPSEIVFDNVIPGQTATVNVTIRNNGTTGSIDDVLAQVNNINSRYNAQVSPVPTPNLTAGDETTVTLTINVPSNEALGKHKIGDFQVTGINDSSAPLSATTPIFVNPQSFLIIKNIEINGKNDGDLEIEEINEINVEVENRYTEDMENVVVLVEILNVDGDDLEEESDDFDLDSGDEEEVTLEFNLRGEELDEDSYKIRVRVEGEAEDGTDHRNEQEITVDVKRERHRVVIKRATIGSSLLQCNLQTTLQVTVENIGKSDEDDVEIKVTNRALGVDLSRANIELDRFSRRDNEHRENFRIEIDNAAPGNYPLLIEVLRDDRVEETQEIPITILECTIPTRNSDDRNPVRSEPTRTITAEQLQQQLEQRRQGLEQTAPVTESSFRGSDAYVFLLGGLILLIFIALALAITLLVSKKRR